MNETLYLIISILSVLSCSRNISLHEALNRGRLVNIKEYGAKGDGRTNDQPSIQRAFRSGNNLYFPKGTYLLATKADAQSILLITERGTPRNIVFEPGAVLLTSATLPADYIKPAVIRILAQRANIPSIRWEGLTIDGNRQHHGLKNPGLVVVDHKGTAVEHLILKDVTIKNTGWNAIYSQAMDNRFSGIRTENNALHGIGFVNYNHRNRVGKVTIDGHLSMDDQGYSIDFSGPKDDLGQPYPGFAWKAEVRNVTSIRSKYGIKTAGHWDLNMENIRVEDSENHGFFINVENRGHVIKARGMTLKNNKGVALNLRGEGKFVGEDIRIENCGKGMLDGLTDIDLRGLTVVGGPLCILGIQIGGPVSRAVIDGFSISRLGPPVQYPIRLKGKHITLRNGHMHANTSVYEILVYPEAGSVNIENVKFSGGRVPSSQDNGIRTLQEKGSLKLNRLDFTSLKGIPVRGDKDKMQIRACSGMKSMPRK